MSRNLRLTLFVLATAVFIGVMVDAKRRAGTGSSFSVAVAPTYTTTKASEQQWSVTECFNSSTEVQCTEKWIFGAGSESPSTGKGEEGDLFWRTDEKALYTKTSGSWVPVEMGAASIDFPISAATGCTNPSYSFAGFATSGLCSDDSGNLVLQGSSVVSGLNLQAAGSAQLIGGAGGDSASISLRDGGSSGEFELSVSSASQSLTVANVIKATTTSVSFSIPTTLASVAFADLGTPGNGTVVYCADCNKATPCTGSGTGAFSKRINSTWDCD